MKNNKWLGVLAIVGGVLWAAEASAAGFDGPYVGAKLGANVIKFEEAGLGDDTRTAPTFGLELGYNRNFGGPVLGANLFADFSGKKTYTLTEPDGTRHDIRFGSNAYGVDGKLGYALGHVMPFAKLGVAWVKHTGDLHGTKAAFHGGAGLEYEITETIALSGEWARVRVEEDLHKTTENAFTLGVNYAF